MPTTTTQTYPVATNRSRMLTPVDWIAMILMIVGGLNWALVGIADFNLVSALFGPQTMLSRIVYVLVGLAALYGIFMVIRWSAEHTHSAAPRTLTP